MPALPATPETCAALIAAETEAEAEAEADAEAEAKVEVGAEALARAEGALLAIQGCWRAC